MAMIFFFFPTSKPVQEFKAMTIGQLHHHQQQPAAAVAGDGAYTYNIVLDAGSTGSRIHIFKFKQQGSSLHLISDGFHQLKPGLSAFPDEPQKAAESLKPLLEEAMKEVPAAQQVRVSDCRVLQLHCINIFVVPAAGQLTDQCGCGQPLQMQHHRSSRNCWACSAVGSARVVVSGQQQL
jgi:hypothetical protein